MISLGTFGENLLAKKTFVYLYCFVLIQLVVITTCFEFMRNPWNGIENQLEKVLEQQNNNLFNQSLSAVDMSNESEEVKMMS
jgi:hypothetical protein